QFEHERMLAVCILEAMNGRDVQVVERGQELRFALEAGQAFAVGRELGWKNLQRHVAIELRIACAIDLAHTAGAERREDLVRAESSSRGKGHLQLWYCEWHSLYRRAAASRDRAQQRPLEQGSRGRRSATRSRRRCGRRARPAGRVAIALTPSR